MNTTQNYDRETLLPRNRATQTILDALALDDHLLVKGKTLIDINFNEGYFVLWGKSHGAKKIIASEGDKEMFEDLKQYIRGKRFKGIQLHHMGFKGLIQMKPKADIVLALDMLHWATAHGWTLDAAVSAIAAMTTETALIEFPWDCEEPCIRAQTKLTDFTYHGSKVINLCRRYFTSVSDPIDIRISELGPTSHWVAVYCKK